MPIFPRTTEDPRSSTPQQWSTADSVALGLVAALLAVVLVILTWTLALFVPATEVLLLAMVLFMLGVIVATVAAPYDYTPQADTDEWVELLRELKTSPPAVTLTLPRITSIATAAMPC